MELTDLVTAFAAVAALFISVNQMRLSNQQKLFDRRLKVWLLVERLLAAYETCRHLIEQPDEPLGDVSTLYQWLTNTSDLHGISSATSSALESTTQLELHLKLDELHSSAREANIIFAEVGLSIELFIENYKDLLFSLYKYQIQLNTMCEVASTWHLTETEAAERTNEAIQRQSLFKAENELADSYERLRNQAVIASVENQLGLVVPRQRLRDRFS